MNDPQSLDQGAIFPSNFSGTSLVVHRVTAGGGVGAAGVGLGAVQLLQAALLSSLALLSSAINSLAVVVFLRRPALRSPSNRFILSLVGGNLLTAAVLFPTVILRLAARRELLSRNTWLRQGVAALTTLAVSGSVHSIVCIAIDRHSAVLSPLHYSSPGTKQKARVLLGSAWGLAIIQAALPPLLGVEPPSLVLFPSAGTTWFKVIYSVLLATLGLLLPLLVLCVIYTRMYRAARKNSERTRRHSLSAPPADNIIDKHHHHHKVIHRQNSVFSREEGRAVKTATMVIATYLLCWTPYFIVLLIAPSVDSIRFIALCAAIINGIVTPFVYVFRGEAVRNEAVMVMCWWKSRGTDKSGSATPGKNGGTPVPPRARAPPLGLGYFDASTEQESMSVHSFNTECHNCGAMSTADFVATYEVVKGPVAAQVAESGGDLTDSPGKIEPTIPTPDVKTAGPPLTPNHSRRESVTFRLAFLPRARRCSSCVRQNSDSSCGSGHALLACRDSSKEESLQGTPQRRKRPLSDPEVPPVTTRTPNSLTVMQETSLTSSGIGRSLESVELTDSPTTHEDNPMVTERQTPVIERTRVRPRLQRLPAVQDESEGFV